MARVSIPHLGGRESGELLRQLRLGEAAAMDPTNAEAVQGGRAVTTLQSRWLHLRCRTCGHTFRTGDAVEIAADGSVRHRSAELPCAGGVAGSDPGSPTITAFFAGIDEAWPPPRDLPVRRLVPGDLLLSPPRGGFRRRACAVCGHTFRPHDHVIFCPCEPGSSSCLIAIHRDPVHGLHCWEDWNPGAYQLHCPATSRQLPGRS